MALTVYFAKVAKRRNSTLQATFSTSIDCVLKAPTSLDRPTFLISAASFDYNLAKYGDRYYFIDDIVSVRNGQFEVSCILDVLATYKTEIVASTQFVSYSSHKTSDWLSDTRIPLQTDTTTAYSTGLTGILSTIGTYVLSVVGESGCATYYTQNEADLTALLNSISTWETTGITDAISMIQTAPATQAQRPPYRVPSDDQRDTCFAALIATISDLADSLNETAVNVQDAMNLVTSTIEEAAVNASFIGNAYANAPQCIRSCIWVPFDYALAPAGTGASPIKLGTFDTGVNMSSTTGKPVSNSFSVQIPWQYNDWRRAVCEDLYLYLPLVGMVQLSGDSLTHVSSLTIEWSVTYTDGVICYKVLAGNEVIGSYGAQCAANYPLGIAQQASAGEVLNSVISGAEKIVSGLIQSTISPISIGGAIGNLALNTVTGVYNVENVRKSTHISCVGGVGGGAGIGLGREAVCFSVAHPTTVAPADMVATMGYPTMKPMSLSTLTGYCQCANAHVEAAAQAQELDALDSYLNSGFYIE